MRGLQGLVGTARTAASRLIHTSSRSASSRGAQGETPGNEEGLRYVGRFAPTPSGPLHFGSLLTAVASYLEARCIEGEWKLRIDDLDAPRVEPGAIDEILRTLECHGLCWDGGIYYQSAVTDRYETAIETLIGQALCFDCTCSRRDLRNHVVYPGTCRHRPARRADNVAIRIRVPPIEFEFEDRLGGYFAHNLAEEVGDFVVVRRDGIVGYQLAVVVDDDAMGVTDVVRGSDLFDNTPRQLFLIERLGFAAPQYTHVPVITERSGVKLSKHTLATAIDNRFPAQNVRTVLDLLGQDPPMLATVDALLDWATSHWRLSAAPRGATLETWQSI